MLRPYMGGDECRDLKNPIGRTFLSGSRIFAETEKSRLSVKPRPLGAELPQTPPFGGSVSSVLAGALPFVLLSLRRCMIT